MPKPVAFYHDACHRREIAEQDAALAQYLIDVTGYTIAQAVGHVMREHQCADPNRIAALVKQHGEPIGEGVKA